MPERGGIPTHTHSRNEFKDSSHILDQSRVQFRADPLKCEQEEKRKHGNYVHTAENKVMW